MDLAFQKFGDGKPLVILHGLLGSSDNWRTLGRQLGERYAVYAVDLRNHGDSPHDPLIDYRVMTEDLHQFLHLHVLTNIALMGHSMGGKVAMNFALTHPELVRKLMVVDIAPKAYSGRHDGILEALSEIDVAALQNRNEADDQLATRIKSTPVRQFLLKNLARNADGGYSWKMNLEAITRHYDAINAGIRSQQTYDGPALFITGEESDYVEESDRAVIRDLFPRANIEPIPGAGHWVHAEQPEAFYRVVCEFLTD